MKVLRAILFFFATLLLYLGVPLFGWGLGGVEQFFSLLPRLGYAIVVALFSLAVGIQAYGGVEGIRGKKGEQDKLVSRQTVVRYILEVSLYIALVCIPLFDRHNVGVFFEERIVRWIGVGFAAIGYGLIFWSGVALGRQYSADVTIQRGHRLITHSIYRYVRHPRYLGIVALSIGISCVFRSWIGLLATIVFLAMLLYRIRDEEKVMHMEFGVEWEAYCRRSWRLVPYFY